MDHNSIERIMKYILIISSMSTMLIVFIPITALAVGSYGANLASSAYQSNTNPFYASGYGGRASDGYDGECTWYAWGRAYEKTGVALPCRGYANDWTLEAAKAGYSTGTEAQANSIMVEHYSGTGHVFFVEKVENGYAYVSEGNWNGYYHEDSINLSTHRRTAWPTNPMGTIDYIYLNSHDPEIYFDITTTTSISMDNATISTWVSNSGSISEMGFYIGSSPEYQNKVITNTSPVDWTRFHLEYNLNSYFGKLSPGKPYYYVFYVINGGKEYKSSMNTFTTGGTAVIDYGKPEDCSSISDYNAHIGAWFWNNDARNISSLGFFYGTSMTSLSRREVTKNVTWTNAYQQYAVGDYATLTPGTRNYVRLYAECDGITYYSDYFYIDTKTYIVFHTHSCYDVLHNDADISIWARNDDARELSSMGFYFGTNSGNLTKHEALSEKVKWTDFNLHYVTSQLTGLLMPSTKYYYQFYVKTSAGIEYKSDIYSFTTKQAISEINKEVLGNPDKVTRFSGHEYRRFDYKVAHWYEAIACCEELGGHLVTITSAEEQAHVETLIKNSGLSYWTGGNDKYKEGNFVWYTGEEFTYTNWDSGQPDNWDSEEDYLTIMENGKWNDVGENVLINSAPVFGFICEFDSLGTHSIIYHLNGGRNAEENPDEFLIDAPLTLVEPSKDHFSFIGWYFSETGDDKFENGSSYDHDLDLYARWEKDEELTFPVTLTEIEEEAFMGSTAVEFIDLTTSNISKIGDYAFKDCSNLKKIYVPDSAVSFGADVFEGCDQVIIVCSKGSAAEAYAVANGLKTQ